MTTYVVFASFEIKADSEDEAIDEVNNGISYLSNLTEIWVQGELDEEGHLVS